MREMSVKLSVWTPTQRPKGMNTQNLKLTLIFYEKWNILRKKQDGIGSGDMAGHKKHSVVTSHTVINEFGIYFNYLFGTKYVQKT